MLTVNWSRRKNCVHGNGRCPVVLKWKLWTWQYSLSTSWELNNNYGCVQLATVQKMTCISKLNVNCQEIFCTLGVSWKLWAQKSSLTIHPEVTTVCMAMLTVNWSRTKKQVFLSVRKIQPNFLKFPQHLKQLKIMRHNRTICSK